MLNIVILRNIMLSVVMLNVVKLSIVVLIVLDSHYSGYRYTECSYSGVLLSVFTPNVMALLEILRSEFVKSVLFA